MIDKSVQDAYWDVVEECIVKFHQKSKSIAKGQIKALRSDLDGGNHPAGELVLHEEPFDTACAILEIPEGDVEPLFQRSVVEYEKILNRHRW